MQPLASIPSPSQGVWHLGPIPLRAYAFMIILGIVVSVWVGERRWTARGGTSGTVVDIAVWAVPFGLVGGRLYHVITDNELYFGSGQHWNPVGALEIWNGGLGIWGAIILGGVGAWIGCRRRGVNFRAFADVLAPGIVLAQAIGRWGNYFNQELYGRPLHTFWALEIDPDHRPRLAGSDTLDPKYADIGTYHPTFLYESIWCVGVAILVIWAGKKYKLNYGRTFALYVAAYTVGRGWIEALRIDNAHHFLGLRLNDYTAILIFLGAVAYLYVYRDKGSVEEVLETGPPAQTTAGARDAAATPPEGIPVTEESAAPAWSTAAVGTSDSEEPAGDTENAAAPAGVTGRTEASPASAAPAEPGWAAQSAPAEGEATAESGESARSGDTAGTEAEIAEDGGEPAAAAEGTGGAAEAEDGGEDAGSDQSASSGGTGGSTVDEVAADDQGDRSSAAGAGEEAADGVEPEEAASGAADEASDEAAAKPWWIEDGAEEPEAGADSNGTGVEASDLPEGSAGENGTRKGARVPESGEGKEQGTT